MASIAIVGPGAIGCAAGGPLVEAGRHVVFFCGNTAFDRILVTYPEGPLYDGPAETFTSPDGLNPVDWVFLCVKAQQVASTAPWLTVLVGPRTRIAVLQNGVEHRERLAPIVSDPTRILPVVVQVPAERTAPGEVTLSGEPTLVVANDPLGTAFKALYAGSRLPVEITSEFPTALWKKMCLNSANGAITAIAERDQSIFRNPDVADLARQIIHETMTIARAEGAELDQATPDLVIAFLAGKPGTPGGGNSMYFDRLAGRELESDARNGILVRLGKKHGIPTPVNATLFTLMKNLKPRTQGSDDED